MPVDASAEIEVTAYRWVPPMARGYVKDLRVRWALEEIDRSYRVRRVSGVFGQKEPAHLADQPFGQVPVYKETGLTLFESGAILIHIGEQDERLLPGDPAARARAIGWVIAALNSVEPMTQMVFVAGMVGEGQSWKDAALDAMRPFAITRLEQLSRALGSREWLEDRFTIGDLVMADVLRSVSEPELINVHENLTAYVERATARWAFQAAMTAQLADFDPDPA